MLSHAFPAKGLTDRVECASYSRVAKVGMIPFNDLLLKIQWYPNFVVEGVYFVVAKG